MSYKKIEKISLYMMFISICILCTKVIFFTFDKLKLENYFIYLTPFWAKCCLSMGLTLIIFPIFLNFLNIACNFIYKYLY